MQIVNIILYPSQDEVATDEDNNEDEGEMSKGPKPTPYVFHKLFLWDDLVGNIVTVFRMYICCEEGKVRLACEDQKQQPQSVHGHHVW